jgi:hypothetical protein
MNSLSAPEALTIEAIEQRRREKDDGHRRELESHSRVHRERHFGSDAIAQIERGWAAGFFDGEGHASARLAGGEFDCSVDQVDVINLERFQRIVGAGKITPITRTKNMRKEHLHRWKVTNQADLNKVWDSIGLLLTPAKQLQLTRAQSVPIRSALENEKSLPPGAISAEILPPGEGNPKD